MLTLAFETSAKAASVALTEDGRLLGESYQNTGLTHSQTLMVMAEDLLKQCGKTVSDVSAVAVAEGPGSFTGVRIGVAAAKGLAWGGHICACMDARRSQVYNALFLVEKGQLQRVSDDRAVALADLKEELEHIDGPIFLVGDGSSLTYKTLSGEIPNLILPKEHRMHQRAVGVALVAERKLLAGEPADGNALSPNYLRLSQAERERAEKMQNAKC